MPKVVKVEHARKDYPEHDIKKGDTYYHWQFAYSKKNMSKTPPTKYQLTRSEFMLGLYAIQDRIESLTALSVEDLQSELDEIISDIENLRDEQQEKLDNMPEQLQESSAAGELLRERIDAMESWASDLQNIDLDYQEEDDDPEDRKTAEEKEADLMEFINNALMEIGSVDPGL
jgi:type I site-specific restriction endonuclease